MDILGDTFLWGFGTLFVLFVTILCACNTVRLRGCRRGRIEERMEEEEEEDWSISRLKNS
ncbi:MAG: hypothetical protein ACFFDP_06655 [Promethearchaeota archaeon]